MSSAGNNQNILKTASKLISQLLSKSMLDPQRLKPLPEDGGDQGEGVWGVKTKPLSSHKLSTRALAQLSDYLTVQKYPE